MAAHELWVEKYRPSKLSDYVFKDEHQKTMLYNWVNEKNLPNCLFSGTAGVGKTTLAKVLINELEINDLDVLEINASRTNSVDDVRNTIINFIQMMPFGDFKVVLLDECLHEDTLVIVKRNDNIINVKIKDINDNIDLVKSYNEHTNQYEWKSLKLLDKGVHEVYKIELESGDTFVCTGSHKWYVNDNGITRVVTTDQLHNYNHILTPSDQNMEQNKIKKIEKLKNTEHVYDLSVEDNHNFVIKDKNEILTHNCDYLSINSQAILRGVFEEYHNSARFILTANYPQKIIPALHSRCQGFHIEKIDHVEYTTKVATILLYENIEFDLDILDTYVKAAYPDLRKCINMVQMNSINGTLRAPDTGDSGTADYKLKMVELFKNGKIQEARKLICSQARQEDFEDIYTWLYQNIELFGDTDKKRDNAILHIKQALVDHTICADSEINFSALMIKLIRNME